VVDEPCVQGDAGAQERGGIVAGEDVARQPGVFGKGRIFSPPNDCAGRTDEAFGLAAR
jgi:hypothetical protein